MKVGDSLRIRHPNRRVKKTSDQASDKGLWPSERVHTEAWHYFLKWKRSGWVCNVCLWTQWLLVWSVSALLIWSRHLKKINYLWVFVVAVVEITCALEVSDNRVHFSLTILVTTGTTVFRPSRDTSSMSWKHCTHTHRCTHEHAHTHTHKPTPTQCSHWSKM